MARIQKMRPLAFKLAPVIFLKIQEFCQNRQKSQFPYLEKGVLELRQAAKT